MPWESTVEDLARDVRMAVRSLSRTPGFVIAAVLILALGIGANTAIFSLVNGLLLRPVPGASLDRVVAIERLDGRMSGVARFALTTDQRRAVEARGIPGIRAMFGRNPLRGALSGGGQVEPVYGELVEGRYFEALGVRAVAGRLLGPADDVDTAVATPVVISERLFRAWFQSNSSAIGTPARLAGQSLVIVGVAPESFGGTWLPTIARADVWLPAAVEHRVRTVQGGVGPVRAVHTFAWLTPDASIEAVHAALAAAGGAIEPGEPDARFGASPAERAILFDDFVQPGLLVGGALTAVSLLVFLIACANLTNLVLARATSRAGDVAVRLALGGARMRVARLYFVETAIVTALAGLVGLGVALALTKGMTLVPLPALENITIRFDPTPDLRVFGYALVVAAAAALAVGMAPAWRITRTDPMRTLTTGGVGGSTVRGRRARAGMVAVQVAMSTVLLILAGLYVRSATVAARFEPGYDTSRATMASVDFRLHGIDGQQGRRIQERMLEEARRIPGVDGAALASGLPPFGAVELTSRLAPEEGSANGRALVAYYTHVSPALFDLLKIPVLAGRPFTGADVDGAPLVAIIDEALAGNLWPSGDAVGRRLRIRHDGPLLEVVGVVPQVATRLRAVPFPDPSMVYLPVAQHDPLRMTVVVTSAAPQAMVEPLRRAIRSVDPELAVLDVKTLSDGAEVLVAPFRVTALVVGALGMIGFGIAVFGLYGVQAFVISQRTRELGIRRALGATTAHIYAAVIQSGLRMVVVGAIAGLAMSAVGVQFIGHLIYGVGPYDVPTFLTVTAALVVTAVVASSFAARRAASVDPNVALRDL